MHSIGKKVQRRGTVRMRVTGRALRIAAEDRIHMNGLPGKQIDPHGISIAAIDLK
jgi:hypothetical protein